MKIFSNLGALIWMSATLALAQEQALVVSSTPVLQVGSDQQARIAYYNVVYDYAGKRYGAQMPYDPGQFVAIQVTPVAPPAAASADEGDEHAAAGKGDDDDDNADESLLNCLACFVAPMID